MSQSRNKAIAYAEDNLGAHTVFANASELVAQLQSDYSTLGSLETEGRDLNLKIERRKQEILVRVTEENGSAAVTAQERAVKLAHAKDEDLQKLQELLNDNLGIRDGITATIRGHEANLKAHTARMNELGGLFQYLAAAKQAQTAMIAQVGDWPWS